MTELTIDFDHGGAEQEERHCSSHVVLWSIVLSEVIVEVKVAHWLRTEVPHTLVNMSLGKHSSKSSDRVHHVPAKVISHHCHIYMNHRNSVSQPT